MYFPALILASLSLFAGATPFPAFSPRQVPAVASVDRYAGPCCTGTICNVAGEGDLHTGCNVITDQCQTSLKLNYKNANCKVTIWKDSDCKDTSQFANVTSMECYALGPPIKGISVDC